MENRKIRELGKCDVSDQYTVQIASCIDIRLNDECWVRPLYGDMLGFIRADGELIIMELSKSEKDHENVYCDVSVDSFVAAPWGHFDEDALNDRKLSNLARNRLAEIKERIVIDEKLNHSKKDHGCYEKVK